MLVENTQELIRLIIAWTDQAPSNQCWQKIISDIYLTEKQGKGGTTKNSQEVASKSIVLTRTQGKVCCFFLLPNFQVASRPLILNVQESFPIAVTLASFRCRLYSCAHWKVWMSILKCANVPWVASRGQYKGKWPLRCERVAYPTPPLLGRIETFF